MDAKHLTDLEREFSREAIKAKEEVQRLRKVIAAAVKQLDEARPLLAREMLFAQL